MPRSEATHSRAWNPCSGSSSCRPRRRRQPGVEDGLADRLHRHRARGRRSSSSTPFRPTPTMQYLSRRVFIGASSQGAEVEVEVSGSSPKRAPRSRTVSFQTHGAVPIASTSSGVRLSASMRLRAWRSRSWRRNSTSVRTSLATERCTSSGSAFQRGTAAPLTVRSSSARRDSSSFTCAAASRDVIRGPPARRRTAATAPTRSRARRPARRRRV